MKDYKQLKDEIKELLDSNDQMSFVRVAEILNINVSVARSIIDDLTSQTKTEKEITFDHAIDGEHVKSLLKRAVMFVEDEEWEKASYYLERVLDENPEIADAHLYKLFIDLKVKNIEELKNSNTLIINNTNYIRAKKYADKQLYDKLIICAKKTTEKCQSQGLNIENEVVVGLGDCADRDIVIPRYNDNGILITSIGESAFECADIDSVIILDNIKEISDSSFSECTLSSLQLPDSLENIGDGAFDCCEKLTSIVIPDGVKRIGERTFAGCDALTSVFIPRSVNYIDNTAFDDSDNIKEIVVDNNDKYCINNGCLINKVEQTLIEAFNVKNCVIPDGIIKIEQHAFEDCEELESVIIPNSVIEIGDYAFERCSNLKFIEIPKSVEIIGNEVFWYCTDLEKIVLPHSIKTLGDSVFEGCSKLTNVYYHGSNEEWEKIKGNNNINNSKLEFILNHDVSFQ